MAALTTRLLTDFCADQVKAVMKSEYWRRRVQGLKNPIRDILRNSAPLRGQLAIRPFPGSHSVFAGFLARKPVRRGLRYNSHNLVREAVS